MPLIEALALCSPQSSKTTLRSWLKEERVSVDGALCKMGSKVLQPGQEVQIGTRPKFSKEGLQILYEDQHLIVINKSEGVLSVASAFEKEETVHAYLKKRFRRVYVVHRLDQETSGVMLFALNERTLDQLKLLFENHDIDREYTAIVEGHLKVSHGRWQNYLYEDANYVVHPTDDPSKGRLAVTDFWVEGTSKYFSRLRLKLETGRKNQIRVQCELAGHPIAGDKKYGSTTSPINRLCLHAHLLGLRHPATGKYMRFESKAPEAFQRLVKL